MSCTSPLLAVDYGLNFETGKKRIKILPTAFRVDWDFEKLRDRYGDALIVLPCGKCDACVLARRKMWSLRCFAESIYHDQNCFVTLTYNDENCPSQLVRKDFQDFIRNLRKKGISCRYFGCGEYGSRGVTSHTPNGRPHYHIILFGFMPSDLKYFSKTNSGFPQYTSSFLSGVWKKGFVTITEFTPEVAGYTAGYVDKKYKQKDCFILMSKKPGLGEQFFLDHHDELYKNDNIVTNFGSHVAAVPRYFDKLAEKIGLDISDLKESRLDAMNYQVFAAMREHNFSKFEEYCKYQEIINAERLNKKLRSL